MISQKRIESLATKDILAYGISYVDLLENKEWKVGSRKWMKEIYAVSNPYNIEQNPAGIARTMSIQKSTQCGMSTMAAVRMFHFADFWPVRIIYMLPRQQDYIDFVTTRVDPMIRNSERLSTLLGFPDSTRSKRFGGSYLFFMESTVEPRMMPADAVFIDEFDLSEMKNVATAQNRMDDSSWRLTYFFSTPTVPNYGVNATFNNSDKREWFVKCPKCGHLQELDWDKNLRVIGPLQRPKEVFFGCLKCDTPLTLEQIQEGFWVPEYPEKSKDHIGFHVSQMMTHTPEHLYSIFLDPLTDITEFYRKNLGKPRELGIGSLEREDMLINCFNEEAQYEDFTDGKSTYYMGVDQGNELQLLIGKVPRGGGNPKIVHLESIPFDKGFERLGQLMKLFRIKRMVIDADPNRHAARDLQKDFLGKILLADYSATTVDWSTKTDDRGVKTNVVIGRSEGFDRLIASIKDSEWTLPGELPNLPIDTETIIDHITAIKRDVEKRKTPSGEKDVAVYRELRASHFAHAWLYLKTAIEIDRGKAFRTAVVGSKENVSGEDVRIINELPNTVTLGISRLLAEVPTKQLIWYVENSTGEMPFPLSHKVKLAMHDDYSEDQIKEVAKYIIWQRATLT